MIRSLPRPLAILCLIFSLAITGAWVFGPEDMVHFLSPKMKANTAFSLSLLSFSLLLLISPVAPPWQKLAGRGFALFALSVGGLTLLQYFMGDFGIDELLRTDVASGENLPYPGRMAPNAAFMFVIGGLALWGRDHANAKGGYYSDYLILGLALMAGGALIGYLYQFSPLFRVANFLRISEYTAGVFLLLSVAMALSRPEHRPMRLFLSDSVEGVLARRLMPTSILFPIFLCWLVSRLRESEVINRPTAYASMAVALIVVFSGIIWWSVRALSKSEKRRREFFEAERRTLSTINQVGQNLVAELNMQKLVQGVTDAATTLTGAQFGAFFYNVINTEGKELLLYTISGVPRERFSIFENPRATAVFHPTFVGLGTVRSDDITKDPRYGKNAPHGGIPKGHLPVRSYLAVSVTSRTGQVLGSLLFGHESPGVFSEHAEKIVEGLAAQTAIAMDNAKLYKDLHDSVRARDEFLSIASHELRTPLTTLKLQAQTRERMINKGMSERFTMPALLKMVQVDGQQIDRLSRLVDDMLDIGRISTGKLTLNFEKFNLADLVREVFERHLPEFQVAGTKLDFVEHAEATILADRHRIEQVVVNLLTNALKYGEGKPVELAVRNRDGHAVVEVRDHGLGIAPENHQRIFERFERAVTASEISGLGLGLFIVRHILTLHGGRISVTSEVGRGSIFVAEIPIAGGSP